MTIQIPVRQKRKMLIDMALRRQKMGTGSSRPHMLRRTATYNCPDLREVLDGIDWMLVGDVATRAYMPERMTNDMDILVRESDRELVTAQLTQKNWSFVQKLAINGATFRSAEQIELDVLFGNQTWLDEAFASVGSDPAGYPVIPLPYLILMKMNSGRLIDLGDIGKMLGWNEDDVINNVRDVVGRYSPADTADLESMILLGRLERNQLR